MAWEAKVTRQSRGTKLNDIYTFCRTSLFEVLSERLIRKYRPRLIKRLLRILSKKINNKVWSVDASHNAKSIKIYDSHIPCSH